MNRVHIHVLAFWIGFACGTIGLFALALLRDLFPNIEVVVDIFFLPSRFFADLLTNGSVSNAMLIVLYLLTGSFYGICASVIIHMWQKLSYRTRSLMIRKA